MWYECQSERSWHGYAQPPHRTLKFICCLLCNVLNCHCKHMYAYIIPWIRKFSLLKIFRRWPTMTKIRRTKIFQCRCDEVRIALLGYIKPIHGSFLTCDRQHTNTFSSMCRLHIVSVIVTKLSFGVFNFRRCAQ